MRDVIQFEYWTYMYFQQKNDFPIIIIFLFYFILFLFPTHIILFCDIETEYDILLSKRYLTISNTPGKDDPSYWNQKLTPCSVASP